MKIDRSRLKTSTSEVPIECRTLIDKLRGCSPAELLAEFSSIEAWTFGKCELYHWIDILDICDGILEEASSPAGENTWTLKCDLEENGELKSLLVAVLQFTTLLIEHSFSRHLYNSMERLVTLLSSCDMHVVLSVLNLLYMFSKRSNFITRLDSDKRQSLLSRLTHLAESWGGRDNGFGLADCCKDLPISNFPPSATTLHFEFYPEEAASVGTAAANSGGQSGNAISSSSTPNSSSAAPTRKVGSNPLSVIHLENVDQLDKTPAEIMDELLASHAVPKDKQMVLLTHLRLAHSFSNYRKRLRCVQARLQALSVLVYSNALIDNSHSLLYPGFLEELVELLELASPHLVDIRAAALRTLTSVIHLDRNPHFPKKPGARLSMIIDVTGASSYHGFLPVLVRTCITTLTQPNACPNVEPSLFPLPLATALFSFLYHLASYEAGGQALVACGMMESLLKVINWPGKELDHITFVTRAVRVIDLITNIDMQAFQTHGGLSSFINRLEMEVNTCRAEQPFEIVPPDQMNAEMEDPEVLGPPQSPDIFEDGEMDTDQSAEGVSRENSLPKKSEEPTEDGLAVCDYSAAKTGKTCLPQRGALLKSMLNFLKKAIQVEDPAFSDSIRRVMEGSLPSSLKHMISNAEYYGPSLFLLATDVVTVYVFQEPSLLSSLQDNGLTDVVLHALLVKEVPATREVLGSLPNVFSALCLNARGLAAFTKCNPFPRIFQVLISQTYLPAMRRRRSSEPMGDTAASLGNAMDELMRHQPTLKQPAMAAIVKLLEDLCALGRDQKYVCWRAQSKQEVSPAAAPSSTTGPGGTTEGPGSSDEDDEDEEEASSSSHQPQAAVEPTATSSNTVATNSTEKTPIALLEFIVNVMKLVEAILSNNSTGDHCREFVQQNGLAPLLSVLGLPNLPVDCPVTTAAQSVSSVCKSILNLTHEPLVLQEGLRQLDEVLKSLQPLHGLRSMGESCSILLQELTSAPSLENAFSTPSATPLLHAMTAAHGYVVMFVHVCRTGQADIRAISVRNWGSELGLGVLRALSKLYVSLVWESALLLALCSDDILPPGSDFGKEDIEKLQPMAEQEGALMSALADMGSNGMTSAMEALSTTEQQPGTMEVEGTSGQSRLARVAHFATSPTHIKYIKPLLAASSRLGRALAELFGLLVKLCVGSPVRPRRQQPGQNAPVLPNLCARSVATSLTKLLARGVNYSTLPATPIPKLRLTFLICSVGFTSPMLFDEKKYPYHLMLHNFAMMGGQEAFFETFRWALSAGGTIPIEEGLESPDLPAGTGEFLDAWLVLLEKMVSPRAILDSPHTISNKVTTTFKAFDPYAYLSQIHKMAFEAVMLMWGKKPLKTYGAHMSESMLAILRHILRGEKLMQEKQAKDEEAKKSAELGMETPSASGLSRRLIGDHAVPQINQELLRSLMDMGFSREMCEEALSQTSNLEQATDYLLNHPVPRSRSLSQATTMDTDMSEDDQMQRAIAISLGESVLAEPTSPGKTDGASAPPKEEPEAEPEALSKTEIDKFTETALQSCLALLDLLPDTVYRACDLLVTITKRNGERYRDEMLDMLTKEISDKVSFLLSVINSDSTPQEISFILLTSPQALKAAVRIHLFTLLFEGRMQHEMRTPCALALHLSGILPSLMQLLVRGSEILVEAEDSTTPKWLAPLLLMLDLLEKVALATQRKEAMHKVSTRIWKWFDLSNGRWTPYSAPNNRIISDAYWSGEPLARISCGRRRYAIQFSLMLQVNETSGNKRPVIMGMVDTYREQVRARRQELGMDMEVDENEGIEVPPVTPEQELKRNIPIMNLPEDGAVNIVKACVKLLSIPVDRDALHAAMRICLRLTRDFKLACQFAELGGVRMLLALTQQSAFTGFLPLCTLLIRHVMEESSTLSLAMEKVIRSKTLPNIPAMYKELMYMFRTCSAAICRHPEIFRQTAERLLRVDISLYKPRYEADETRLLLKCLPTGSHTPAPTQRKVSQAVVYDLLNALAREPETKEENKAAAATPAAEESQTTPTQRGRAADTAEVNCAQPFNTSTAAVQLLSTSTAPQNVDDMLKKSKDDAANQGSREEEKKAPLLPKSSILRLLAEAVRSYSQCAKLVTDYHYTRGQSPLITEDCSALAFLLDHLLPASENSNDRECPAMARMLVAALASCTHSSNAQTTLVIEVKNALTRTLQLPESTEKSSQIQALAGLISTMIENCPPSTSTTPSNSTPHAFSSRNQQMSGVNNMVRIMLRRGLVTDLARVVHSLDLSSPNTAATVNAALKPLETLSRIMTQPATGWASRHKFPRTKAQTSEGDPLALPDTPTSEATHAQGEDAAEDPDNTDHDVSGATESMEPSSESRGHQDNHDHCLDDIMDSMLVSVFRDRQGSSSSAFVNQVEGMDVEPRDDDLMNECTRDQLFSEQGHHIDDDDTSDTGTNQSGEGEDQADNDNESSSSSSSSSSTTGEDEEDEDDEDDDDDGENPEEIRRDIQMFREGVIAHANGEEPGFDAENMEIFPNEQGLLRLSSLDRDNEDILMIQYSDDASNQVVPWNPNAFSLNLGLYEDASNGNDNAGAMLNPAAPNHPLLSARHSNDSNNTRNQRVPSRQRRLQYVRVNMRQPQANTPMILQHLLGPLTSNMPFSNAGQAIANSFRDSRVVLMDNTLGFLANGDDDHIDLVGESGFLFGTNLALTMNSTPTALNWWIEETKILDAECSADLVFTTAHSLVGHLKRFRDEELYEQQLRMKRAEVSDDRRQTRQDPLKKRIRVDSEVGRMFERPAVSNEDDSVFVEIEPPVEEAEVTTAPSAPAAQAAGISDAVTVRETVPVEGGPGIHDAVTPIRESMPVEGLASTESAVTVAEAETQLGAGEVLPLLTVAPAQVPADKVENEEADLQAVTTPSAPPPTEATPIRATAPAAAALIAAIITPSTTPLPAASSATPAAAAAETPVAPAEGATSAETTPVPPATEGETSTPTAPEEGAVGSSSSSGLPPGQELPEGVDPSFLAALPDDMREEVIAEQLRLQRLRQQTLESANSGASGAVTQVNPEFLAALPPNIQEEVLSQQRLEQQRQAAASANPEDPVDTAAFFQNLQPALRQAILADMEDSQIAALPPELAAEAQSLRREWESRNRHLQDRFFNHGGASALSTILRTTAALRRLSTPGRSGTRYSIQTVPQRNIWIDGSQHWPVPDRADQDALALSSGTSANLRVCGRPLLDHEAVTCLLVLLFLDEPKLNTGRLHRVFRNLCYHYQTREWIIKALLSILERSNESRVSDTPALPPVEPASRTKRMSTRASQAKHTESSKGSAGGNTPALVGGNTPARSQTTTSWLNVSVDAALGCRANIFHVNRPPSAKKGYDRTAQPATILVHRQAAPIVCRHVLDLLILLAKSFPGHFLPVRSKEQDGAVERVGMETRSRASTSGASSGNAASEGATPNAGPSSNNSLATSPGSSGNTTSTSSPATSAANEFWDLLLKLDNMTSSRKGKNLSRSNSNAGVERSGDAEPCHPSTFDSSAFGQLLNMLDSPVVKRSTVLTDKLLRLLSLVSLGLPDIHASVPAMAEQQVRLAVQVLTSKSCSEEGLEDTTALLLNLASCPEPMRDMILRLLLEGAMKLANTVCEHISALMKELEGLNQRRQRDDNNSEESSSESRQQRGTVHDRFTNDMVVVTAPTKPKGGADLQLPSMAPLTSKTSSQAFFLRILKVIIQLREAARTAARKKATSGASAASGETSTSAADVASESRAGAGNDYVRTRPRGLRWRQPRPQRATAGQTDGPAASSSTSSDQASRVAVAELDTESEDTDIIPVPPLISAESDDAMAMDTTAPEPAASTSSALRDRTVNEEDKDTEDEDISEVEKILPNLSEQLQLDILWETLSSCLLQLADTPDHHAVLMLQPAVEAFFLVHASPPSERTTNRGPAVSEPPALEVNPRPGQAQPQTPSRAAVTAAVASTSQAEEPSPISLGLEAAATPPVLSPDQQKFLKFAETHRTVLNQILRQSTAPLADGPFAGLVDHVRILDFDVKRRYFRTELERLDDGLRREELAVHVRRSMVFEDSFRELQRRPVDEWKNRFYIVFEGEEGQDAGGLLREWYVIISREIFNPMYALFTTSPGDRVTYMINSSSHCNPNHLCYFKFVGRVIAKAIYDNKLLECYFTRSFYKHILGIPVKYTDMESEDYSFYQGLVYLMEHMVSALGYDLTFSAEVQEFGVTEIRDLIPNGRNIPVTEENKMDYIRLVCQMKMTGAIRKQLNAFLEGFYDIIPKRLISIFNEQELELLISGLPNVDIEDLKANTEYHKYQPTSLQIQWFWRALRSFDQADRAKFLQFVTGTSKVPLQGFGALEGMNGVQKFQIHRDDRSTDRLPSAHTCFNQLDLPVYETYDKLRSNLLKAIHECSEGFGFA